MKSLLLTILILTTLLPRATEAMNLDYKLRFPQPQAHYVTVEMDLSAVKGKTLEVQMPVWAPGSYLIREFERNVENFKATSGSKSLDWQKTDKNTWRIELSGKDKVKISYDVYAYELSVRTSFIDADQAYLNGSSIFMYVKGAKDQSATLTIDRPGKWKTISTSLSLKEKDNVFTVPNYDILADAPIQIGNHKVFEFLAAGLHHRLALVNESNFDEGAILPPLTRLIEESTKIFGTNPTNDYLFIVHNNAQRGGGLEHLNSTTLMYPRWGYDTPGGIESFLSLATHEYLHLWNVKRLRPKGLGPFDYTKETHTNLLWVAEGVTSYYDELLLYRAGVIDEKSYLSKVADNITRVENTPGNKVQSVADASFDAWVKAYRRDENANNTQVSYYSKGTIIAQMLDLNIIHHSKAKHNLDDVMKYLYETVYQKSDRGYTDEDVQKAVEKFAGVSMDDFFKMYIFGTEPIPYDEYFGYAGMYLKDKIADATPNAHLGISLKKDNGQMTVADVARGTAAYDAGINVNDELIAVNGYRATNNFDDIMRGKKVGDRLEIMVSRSGRMMTIPVTLGKSNSKKYELTAMESPSKEQQKVKEKWLSK